MYLDLFQFDSQKKKKICSNLNARNMDIYTMENETEITIGTI